MMMMTISVIIMCCHIMFDATDIKDVVPAHWYNS